MAENPSGSLVVKPWARKLRLDAAFQVRGAEIADRDVFCWLTMAHDGTCSDPQMAYFREENDVQPAILAPMEYDPIDFQASPPTLEDKTTQYVYERQLLFGQMERSIGAYPGLPKTS